MVARGQLRRDALTARALHIADAEGLDAVSFRRLAAEFAVTPMALYRHVRDRDDLMDAMADVLLADIRLPPDEPIVDWLDALRTSLRCAARVIADHPGASDILRAGTGMSPHSLRLTEAWLGVLVGAGFSPSEAMVVVQQLSAILLAPRPKHGAGSPSDAPPNKARRQPTIAQLAEYPYLRSTLLQAGAWIDAARDRDFGVELLLAGVRSLLERKHTP
jgi:TetR/AcrR family transcriptional regulator, tetracycline repressor protein